MAKFDLGSTHAYIFSTLSSHPSTRAQGEGPNTLIIHAHGCYDPRGGTVRLPAHTHFYFDSEAGKPADSDRDAFAIAMEGKAIDFSKFYDETGEKPDYYLYKYRVGKERSKEISEQQEGAVAKAKGRFDILIPRNKRKDKVKDLNTGAIHFSSVVRVVADYACYDHIICSFCRVTIQEALANFV